MAAGWDEEDQPTNLGKKMNHASTVYSRLINLFLAKMRPGYPHAYSLAEITWLTEDTEVWEIQQYGRELFSGRTNP